MTSLAPLGGTMLCTIVNPTGAWSITSRGGIYCLLWAPGSSSRASSISFLDLLSFFFVNMHDSLPITPITTIHSIRYIINPLNYSSCIRVSTYPFITKLWVYTQVQYENLVSHIKSLGMHFLIIPVLHALSGDMQMLTSNFMGFFQSCD